MERRIYYQIKAADLPCRAQEILRRRLGLTAHQIRSVKFRPGGLLVNQKQARVNVSLAEGDVVEVLLEQRDAASGNVEASLQDPDILYEDDDLLAVNKPAGVPLHPAHGHYRDTLSNEVQGYYQSRGMLTRVRPIGRLDRDTSGIVLFAKNQVAAARLWESGSVQKKYLALAAGRLGERSGSLEAPIGKKAGTLNEMEVSDTGKYAKTNYEVLEEFEDCSLVILTPETGRTHQIRVHMSYLGHPLIGDPIYGKHGEAEAMSRAALHCWRVTVRQPFTGERIELEAPLPEDMRQLICARTDQRIQTAPGAQKQP